MCVGVGVHVSTLTRASGEMPTLGLYDKREDRSANPLLHILPPC